MDVIANRYSQASPVLVMLEHKREFFNEMKRNSQIRNDPQVKKKKKAEERGENVIKKNNCFTEREKRWPKVKGKIYFFFSKQMGIWQALYRFQNCHDNENKVDDLTCSHH